MDTDINEVLRQALRTSLTSRNISASEAARISGVEVSFISRVFSGKIQSPAFDKIFAVFSALGLPLPATTQEPQYTKDELLSMAARGIAYPVLSPTNDDRIKAEKSLSALLIAGAVRAK